MTDISDFSARLAQCFEQSGLEAVSHECAAKLYELKTLLQSANERINLTSITDDDGIILKHFADCAAIAPLPRCGARVLDVGCGGGFPSLPLAVLRPDLRITALDSTAKKLAFVGDAAHRLSLPNISTLAARAEQIARAPYRDSFGFVCARAVARLGILSELCLPFVEPENGIFAAMKSEVTEEIADDGETVELLGGRIDEVKSFTLRLDAQELRRSVVIISKSSPTPPQYPRNYSLIKSRPPGTRGSTTEKGM